MGPGGGGGRGRRGGAAAEAGADQSAGSAARTEAEERGQKEAGEGGGTAGDDGAVAMHDNKAFSPLSPVTLEPQFERAGLSLTSLAAEVAAQRATSQATSQAMQAMQEAMSDAMRGEARQVMREGGDVWARLEAMQIGLEGQRIRLDEVRAEAVHNATRMEALGRTQEADAAAKLGEALAAGEALQRRVGLLEEALAAEVAEREGREAELAAEVSACHAQHAGGPRWGGLLRTLQQHEQEVAGEGVLFIRGERVVARCRLVEERGGGVRLMLFLIVLGDTRAAETCNEARAMEAATEMQANLMAAGAAAEQHAKEAKECAEHAAEAAAEAAADARELRMGPTYGQAPWAELRETAGGRGRGGWGGRGQAGGAATAGGTVAGAATATATAAAGGLRRGDCGGGSGGTEAGAAAATAVEVAVTGAGPAPPPPLEGMLKAMKLQQAQAQQAQAQMQNFERMMDRTRSLRTVKVTLDQPVTDRGAALVAGTATTLRRALVEGGVGIHPDVGLRVMEAVVVQHAGKGTRILAVLETSAQAGLVLQHAGAFWGRGVTVAPELSQEEYLRHRALAPQASVARKSGKEVWQNRGRVRINGREVEWAGRQAGGRAWGQMGGQAGWVGGQAGWGGGQAGGAGGGAAPAPRYPSIPPVGWGPMHAPPWAGR